MTHASHLAGAFQVHKVVVHSTTSLDGLARPAVIACRLEFHPSGRFAQKRRAISKLNLGGWMFRSGISSPGTSTSDSPLDLSHATAETARLVFVELSDWGNPVNVANRVPGGSKPGRKG